MSGEAPVRGRVDPQGRLIEAEPRLAALQRAAGGEEGGPLAVPQVAALARLARRLGIVISRGAVAAQLDVYDALDSEQAIQHILLWRLDPAYRAAVARLAA